MADGKKSVLLYCDLIHTIEKMDNETAGLFFKHYLRYINDLNPVTDNLIVDITFESVKQSLKRDLCKWESRADNSRNNGKLGGRPKKEETQKTQQVNLKPKKPVNVTVTDTVNVNVIKKFTIEERKLKFAETLKDYLDLYGKDMMNDFFKYWTEPNSTNSKLKFELQKTWSVKLRLERWAKNNNNFKNLNNGNKQQTADERLQEAKSRILGEDSEFSESKPNNEDIEFTSFENVGSF